MRPMSITLTVYGQAAPKGSRTLARRRDGSTYTRPASNREPAWTEAVAQQARWTVNQSREIPAPPYRVEMVFYLARPARPAHEHPSRTDVDKLVRAVLDGLVTGGLLTDDRHVTELVASKAWAATPADECVHVIVSNAATVERLAA